MSETENLATDTANQEILTIDLRKTIAQHLKALTHSGVETLPKGTGHFAFSLSEADSPQPKLPSDDGTPLLKSNADHVAEANPGLLIDRRSTSENEVEISPKPIHREPINSGAKNLDDVAKPIVNTRNESGYHQSSLPPEKRRLELEIIQTQVAACMQCSELAASRSQTVFGVGNITPRLVFVGEAPGADEDRIGEPFVGAAGQLLDKIMAASQLKRSEVYILNTVKCRPPANRNPSPAELDNCWGYAERQLEILQPEFICCLGTVAAKRLLNSNQSLGRLRQTFHRYRGSRVLVTYHPAYLLRTESAKKHVWADMKMLMKEMGIDLTK